MAINLKTSTPTAAFVKVTPALATDWLETQQGPDKTDKTRNRKFSERRADLYAAMMKRDDWYATNQGIGFDTEGCLFDGQHRLTGIIKANMAATLLVVTGLPRKSQLVVDQGFMRRAEDQIRLREGWDVTARHVAVAKQMILGVHPYEHYKVLPDVIFMHKFYVTHHKAVEFALACFDQHAQVRGVSVTPVMAPVARAFYSQDHNRLKEFADILLTGLSARLGDSGALVLRNWMIAGRDKKLSSRRYGERQLIYKKSSMALDAFIKKQQIKVLGKDLTYELFPIPKEATLIKALVRTNPQHTKESKEESVAVA
jgi:hypothetical protein